MGKVVIDWLVLAHNIVPFAAAQLFIVVLIYFTLVRERISKEYLFYACFLISFILYLIATLINILPIPAIAVYVHYLSSFILFSFGFPSLVVALFIQSKIKILPIIKFSFYALGIIWSIFYFVTAEVRTDKVNVLSFLSEKGAIASWVSFDNVFLTQSLFIVIVLILPGLYLLTRMPVKQTKAYVYGMLILGFFALLGSLTQFWAVYYLGSSLCAFTWAWAMFTDIRHLNEQVKSYSIQGKSFASAQFAVQNREVSMAEFYPDTLDESYPFRERDALLEAIETASGGLVPERVELLIASLEQFSHNNEQVFKVRIREVLYLIVDIGIYLGGNAKALIIRLEQKGQLLEHCNTTTDIIKLINDECLYLIQNINVSTQKTSVDSLVERLKACVLSNYHKEELSIDTIASEVGVSRSHAMKSFKSKQGITLNQYIINTRVNKAKSHLLKKSVTETAFDVGFKNANYFSTFFRKHTDLSPKQFQQQARNEKN